MAGGATGTEALRQQGENAARLGPPCLPVGCVTLDGHLTLGAPVSLSVTWGARLLLPTPQGCGDSKIRGVHLLGGHPVRMGRPGKGPLDCAWDGED